jgi:hypothetical protein
MFRLAILLALVDGYEIKKKSGKSQVLNGRNAIVR